MDSKPILILTNIALAAVLLYGFSTASTSSSLHDERQENCVTSPAPALVRGRLFGKHAITPASLRVNRPIGHSASTPVPPPVETPTHVVPAPQPVDTPSFAEPAPQPPLPVPAQSTDEKTAAPIPSAANNEGRDLCASAPQSSLIYYQRFENGTLVDEVGNFPNGTLVQGTIVPGKDGNALHVEARQPGAFVSMPTNALGPAGCIEFWAKIDNPSARIIAGKGSPCFFHMQPPNDIWKVSLMWNGNNGAGGGGLCGAVQHYPAFSEPFAFNSSAFDKLLGDTMTDWHHYALVWNTKGIETLGEHQGLSVKVAVYLDGHPAALDTNVRNPVWGLSCFSKTAMTLGFPMPPEMSDFNEVAYTIDEFKIWNFDKFEF